MKFNKIENLKMEYEEKFKKLKLAEALKEEYNRLVYMGRLNKEDYDLAIKYLKTGEHLKYYDDFDLLYACIEDFEQMCSDYDIK